MKNPQALLLIFYITLFSSVALVFILIEENLLKKYGATTSDLAFFTLLSIPLSIVAMLGFGWYSGKTGRFKCPLVMIVLVAMLTLVVVLALLNLKIPSVFGVALMMTQICMTASYSICFEFLAELTFPVGKIASFQLRHSL